MVWRGGQGCFACVLHVSQACRLFAHPLRLLQTLEVFLSLELFPLLPISVFFRDAMHSAPVSTCAPVFDHLTKKIRLHAHITMHVQARKARHATACGVHALVHRCVLCFFQPWCGTTNIYATLSPACNHRCFARVCGNHWSRHMLALLAWLRAHLLCQSRCQRITFLNWQLSLSLQDAQKLN